MATAIGNTKRGTQKSGGTSGSSAKSGAGDAIRTRDIFLGKEVLYQLSYTRGASTAGRRLQDSFEIPSG